MKKLNKQKNIDNNQTKKKTCFVELDHTIVDKTLLFTNEVNTAFFNFYMQIRIKNV